MCIQLMIHNILLSDKTEDDIKNDIRAKKGASHDYYIIQTIRLLGNNRQAINRFNNKIKELKTFREESDYGNCEIDERKANLSYETSLELKDIFRSALSINL